MQCLRVIYQDWVELSWGDIHILHQRSISQWFITEHQRHSLFCQIWDFCANIKFIFLWNRMGPFGSCDINIKITLSWAHKQFGNRLSTVSSPYIFLCVCRADSRLAPSQRETSLQSDVVSYWLGANLKSALCIRTSPATCALLPKREKRFFCLLKSITMYHLEIYLYVLV